MVFENLVVYLLDKYLSDYIENLDTKKLKIDLWNGKFCFRQAFLFLFLCNSSKLGNVVLENLYLKPNALVCLFNLKGKNSIKYIIIGQF